jgi:hypothetical protein
MDQVEKDPVRIGRDLCGKARDDLDSGFCSIHSLACFCVVCELKVTGHELQVRARSSIRTGCQATLVSPATGEFDRSEPAQISRGPDFYGSILRELAGRRVPEATDPTTSFLGAPIHAEPALAISSSLSDDLGGALHRRRRVCQKDATPRSCLTSSATHSGRGSRHGPTGDTASRSCRGRPKRR